MTIRFKKKVRKWRGGTSHGWGMKKKHRGGGSLGGRGYSGRHKHKYTLVTTTYPDWYGRRGFHSLEKKVKIINAGDLHKISKETNIDLTKMGYGKLLSRGEVKKAYILKVAKFTPKAKEKIEKAGGSINK